MWIGRYGRGDEVILSVSCEDASKVVTAPDEAPTVEVFDADSKKLTEAKMPASDASRTPGLFRLPLFLGAAFDAGSYVAVIRYLLSGVSRTRTITFEVSPLGDAAGAVQGMYQFEKPNSRFLVHSTASGRIFKGKNPRLPR